MIYDPDGLFALVAQHAERQHLPVPITHATMRTIVAEAERLAAGRSTDEPAALFYACARRARLFGKVATRFMDMVGGIQADAVGLTLDATELDLTLLRGRIAYNAAGWEEVRDAFAGWLRPPGAPPKASPPKRLR
jgi:hypothetical protein